MVASLRRVYGGRWLGIVLRGGVIAVAYLVLFVLAVVGLLIASLVLELTRGQPGAHASML